MLAKMTSYHLFSTLLQSDVDMLQCMQYVSKTDCIYIVEIAVIEKFWRIWYGFKSSGRLFPLHYTNSHNSSCVKCGTWQSPLKKAFT